MKLAFWNVKGEGARLEGLARCMAPDVMIGGECREPDETLARLGTDWRRVDLAGRTRLTVFYRRTLELTPIASTSHGEVMRVVTDNDELLVGAVHFRSRMHATQRKISSLDAASIRAEILRAEERLRHRNTVLIGDFNLDPFDWGLSDRGIFWGTMERRLAQRLCNNDGVFYNPMWSRLGDGSRGPPGTFYYSNDADGDYSFHTFDQVLIRPELVPRFRHRNLKVLTRLDGEDLVNVNWIPQGSDHLPLLLELEDADG